MAVGYVLHAERVEIQAQQGDRLGVQARVIADNLGRQLQGVDAALAGIRSQLAALEGPQLAQLAGPRLQALNEAMPGVRSIHVLDADGRVVATSRDSASIGRSFAERELFTTPRERPDPALLYVSPPYTTRRDGVFTVNVGRTVIDAAGASPGWSRQRSILNTSRFC